jgi:MFS family permease
MVVRSNTAPTAAARARQVRAASGLLNGNVPILKAYMGTITDSTNQAAGMSILALSWGLGSAVGPLLGGFLAEPAVTLEFGRIVVSEREAPIPFVNLV